MAVAVTVFPVPAFLSEKFAVPREHATSSLPTTGLTVQLATTAVVLPSYVLLLTAIAGVTFAGLTVSAVLPEILGEMTLVAVMVALPTFSPDALPVWSMAETVVSELDHCASSDANDSTAFA